MYWMFSDDQEEKMQTFMEKCLGKRPLEKPRRLGHREMSYEGKGLMELAQYHVQLRPWN
jgi:hypothetical protein